MIIGMNEPDPYTVLPSQAFQCDLYKNNRFSRIVTTKSLMVGHQSFVAAVKAINRTDGIPDCYDIRIAKRCEQCKGLGTISKEDKTPCPECHGIRYAYMCNGKPSDMLLRQTQKDKIRDMIESHAEMIDEYVRHTILAKTYLANPAENRIFKSAAKEPVLRRLAALDEGFPFMEDLLKQYEKAPQEERPALGESDFTCAPVGKAYGNLTPTPMIIIRCNPYERRDTGEPMMSIVGQQPDGMDNLAFKVFTPASDDYKPGRFVTLTDGTMTGVEHNNFEQRPIIRAWDATIA